MKRIGALLSLCLAACLYSKDNREGLDLSCAELDGSNACRDGIITSCMVGGVQYRVCDDEEACSKGWQQQGRFRCDEAEVVPDLVLTGAGGTSSSGEGGAARGGAASSGGSQGSLGELGGAAGMTTSTGCSNAPCVAATVSRTLSALVDDEANLYFAGCNTIWSLPKAGGFASELATLGSGPCGELIRLAVNSTHVYASHNNESVIGVPKTGGSTEVIATSSSGAGYLAAGDDHVFWGQGPSLQSYIPGGAPETVVENAWPGRVVVESGFVYWSQGEGLGRIPTSGGAMQVMVLGGEPRDFAFLGGSVVALLPDRIVAPSLTDSTDSTLVQVEDGWALAVRDSDVYWTTQGKVHTVPMAGGEPVELASGTTTINSPGSLVADDAAIYWIGGATVFKLERSP